jgi:hypothetical protein
LGVTGKKILIPVILISVILIVAVCIFGGSTIGNNQGSNTRPNGFVSTENQAVEIALPLAQAYAQEYNLAITTTKATFIESNNPYWFVEIEFQVKEWEHSRIEKAAYEIAVWADTGKIYHHGSMQVIVGSEAQNGSSEENVKITLDKAVEIALPLAQTYAQENNRTTTTLTSTCYLDTRPSWDVIINFEVIETEKGEPISEQCGISGYYIGIWADTGEIRTHSVINLAGFLGRETDTVGNPALETTNRLVLAV